MAVVYVRSEEGNVMCFGPGCSIMKDLLTVLAVNPTGWAMVLERKETKEETALARDEWAFAVACSPDEKLIWRDDEGELSNRKTWPIPETMKGKCV